MNKIIIYFLVLTAMLVQVYGQEHWTKHPDNPVFEGKSGEFDSNCTQFFAIIENDNQYHMWYSGFDGGSNGSRVGYAVSDDGISWESDHKPVLQTGPGSWDNFSIQQPTVLYDGTTWHMWFCALNESGLNTRQIGYATSEDKINWTKYENNPVLGPGSGGSWDYEWVGWPKVLLIDGLFHMWYTGGNGSLTQIGHATSSDGITWEKDPQNPVLTVGASGEWDDLLVSNPTVSYHNGQFHMWYCGARTAFGDWKVGYAVSDDGINWGKISLVDPVMDLGSAGEWDDKFVAGGVVVIFDADSDTLKMWYGGGRDNNITRIGYATSIGLLDVISEDAIETPDKFALNQNYPNPFNPSTVISYQVGAKNLSPVHIELNIYDVLGKKVTTLVNKEQPAGTYTVTWNAAGFTSGLYYYSITAGEFRQVKKMVLVR